MKTLIIFALLPVLCQAFIDHEVLLRRAKRQAMTYTDLRTIQCVRGCVIEFSGTLKTMKDARNSYFVNEALLDKRRLDKFCQSYDQLDTCIKECNAESNTVAQTLVKMFEPFDIICKTRHDEFVSYLPCYSKSRDATKQRCTASCGDAESFSKDLQRKFTNQLSRRDQENLMSVINNIMDQTCDFASCHQRCQSRVIIETCQGETGQNAAEFMAVFSEQAIKSVSQGLKVVAPELNIPEDCFSREEPSDDINRSESNNDAIATYEDI